MRCEFKNTYFSASKDVHNRVYNIPLSLVAFGKGFFMHIPDQRRPQDELIISNSKQKASSLFTTKSHEREQCPTCNSCPTAHFLMDSGNIEAATLCK